MVQACLDVVRGKIGPYTGVLQRHMFNRFEAGDHVDSDNMDKVLEYTKHVHRNNQQQGGTSRGMGNGVDRNLKERIRLLKSDIHQYNRDIEDLTKV